MKDTARNKLIGENGVRDDFLIMATGIWLVFPSRIDMGSQVNEFEEF